MIEYRTFRAGHLDFFTPQDAQVSDYHFLMRSGNASALEGLALSAWVNHRCIAAGGLIRVWPHRAVAWLLLSEQAGPHLAALTLRMRKVIKHSGFSRIEFTVADEFAEGHRFAEAIGAECETPYGMQHYGADNGCELMYSLTKRNTSWLF